jgi:hypothetical protein
MWEIKCRYELGVKQQSSNLSAATAQEVFWDLEPCGNADGEQPLLSGITTILPFITQEL